MKSQGKSSWWRKWYEPNKSPWWSSSKSSLAKPANLGWILFSCFSSTAPTANSKWLRPKSSPSWSSSTKYWRQYHICYHRVMKRGTPMSSSTSSFCCSLITSISKSTNPTTKYTFCTSSRKTAAGGIYSCGKACLLKASTPKKRVPSACSSQLPVSQISPN